MGSVDSLKQAVQELQRDITLRRSLTKDLTINDLKTKISQTEELLDVHLSTIEEKQPSLEQVILLINHVCEVDVDNCESSWELM